MYWDGRQKVHPNFLLKKLKTEIIQYAIYI